MRIHADHVKHRFPEVDTDDVDLHLVPFPFSIAATATDRRQTISLRLELVSRRQDVAFVVAEFGVSERRACKLMGMDRTSYRYQPRPDHNAALREELICLARQRPRYGYRRLAVLLEKRGLRASPQRVYRVYREEHLAVRRLKRKRLLRPAPETAHLSAPNQEWAIDFVADGLATGRGLRILTIVDCFTRECLAIEADTSLSSRRVTRVLEWVIGQRGPASVIRCDNELNARGTFVFSA